MKHELPPEPVRSCPRLNWLAKPGEPVRYYRWCDGDKKRREGWIEVTAAEAYRIAESRDGTLDRG